jgi:hypothetical protein
MLKSELKIIKSFRSKYKTRAIMIYKKKKYR